jgi:hypothetical protein
MSGRSGVSSFQEKVSRRDSTDHSLSYRSYLSAHQLVEQRVGMGSHTNGPKGGEERERSDIPFLLRPLVTSRLLPYSNST